VQNLAEKLKEANLTYSHMNNIQNNTNKLGIVKDKLDTDRSIRSNLSCKTIHKTDSKSTRNSNDQLNKWDISSSKQQEHLIKNCWDISNNQSFEIGNGYKDSECDGIPSMVQSKSTINHLLDNDNDQNKNDCEKN